MMPRQAIILGATGGLGRALLEALLQEGWQILAVGRDEDILNQLAAQSRNVSTFQADLAKPGVMQQIAERCPAPDLLIHCAGGAQYGPLGSQSHCASNEAFSVNAGSVLEMFTRFAPAMAARETAGIITIASTAAARPAPGFALYSASKAFTLGLSRSLAREYAGSGLKITCCIAGPIATQFPKRAGYPQPVKGCDPAALARKLLASNAKGQSVIYSTVSARLRWHAFQLLPSEILDRLWRRRNLSHGEDSQ